VFGFLKRILGDPTRGPSLPLDLARRGWKPYKFAESNVLVFLPPSVAADFDPEGVLLGSSSGKEVEFSATLHRDFKDRLEALDFVSHLAGKNGGKVKDIGTYRYFLDPTNGEAAAPAMRFWVVGIPGAVVVVSILCKGHTPVSKVLQEVSKEFPHIIGELM